jgi:hypothetical protein
MPGISILPMTRRVFALVAVTWASYPQRLDKLPWVETLPGWSTSAAAARCIRQVAGAGGV